MEVKCVNCEFVTGRIPDEVVHAAVRQLVDEHKPPPEWYDEEENGDG